MADTCVSGTLAMWSTCWTQPRKPQWGWGLLARGPTISPSPSCLEVVSRRPMLMIVTETTQMYKHRDVFILALQNVAGRIDLPNRKLVLCREFLTQSIEERALPHIFYISTSSRMCRRHKSRKEQRVGRGWGSTCLWSTEN